MTPILRDTFAEASRAALAQQSATNARCIAALRAMLGRNQQQQEAVERLAAVQVAGAAINTVAPAASIPASQLAGNAPPGFDAALERLIVAAWKGKDVSKERAAVHRIFAERLDADPEIAECLEITHGMVREGVLLG